MTMQPPPPSPAVEAPLPTSSVVPPDTDDMPPAPATESATIGTCSKCDAQAVDENHRQLADTAFKCMAEKEKESKTRDRYSVCDLQHDKVWCGHDRRDQPVSSDKLGTRFRPGKITSCPSHFDVARILCVFHIGNTCIVSEQLRNGTLAYKSTFSKRPLHHQ